MNRRLLLDRRKFLASAGATALTLPFLEVLPSYAQTEDKRYLILVFSPNGVVRERWGVTSTGPGPSDFTFKPYLAPLTPYKDKVNVFDGLDNEGAGGGSHEAGMASLWTGAKVTGDLAPSESIDQYITRQARFATRYPSLEFQARSPEDYNEKSVKTRMIYSGARAPLDPRDDADLAMNLFAGVTGTPMVDTRGIAMRAKLFSHLDAELGALNPRLCSEDRIHLDALRTGFGTLRARLDDTAPPPAQCQMPTTDVAGLNPYPAQTKKMIDVLAMSIACDFARVLSLQFSHAVSPMVASWLDIREGFHDISHKQPFPFDTNPGSDALTAIENLTKINVFFADQVAYLCQRLSAFPGQNGGTLLDQCVICWSTDIDHGQLHDHNNTPFVTIGSAGGRLQTGRVFEVAGRKHNDLLVSLANAMGVATQSFGPVDLNQGPIPGLLGA
jgi:hypothetical protein